MQRFYLLHFVVYFVHWTSEPLSARPKNEGNERGKSVYISFLCYFCSDFTFLPLFYFSFICFFDYLTQRNHKKSDVLSLRDGRKGKWMLLARNVLKSMFFLSFFSLVYFFMICLTRENRKSVAASPATPRWENKGDYVTDAFSRVFNEFYGYEWEKFGCPSSQCGEKEKCGYCYGQKVLASVCIVVYL